MACRKKRKRQRDKDEWGPREHADRENFVKLVVLLDRMKKAAKGRKPDIDLKELQKAFPAVRETRLYVTGGAPW